MNTKKRPRAKIQLYFYTYNYDKHFNTISIWVNTVEWSTELEIISLPLYKGPYSLHHQPQGSVH